MTSHCGFVHQRYPSRTVALNNGRAMSLCSFKSKFDATAGVSRYGVARGVKGGIRSAAAIHVDPLVTLVPVLLRNEHRQRFNEVGPTYTMLHAHLLAWLHFDGFCPSTYAHFYE